MYVDDNGNFSFKIFAIKIATTLVATALAVAITAAIIIDAQLTAEANNAKSNYKSNTIDNNLEEGNIVFSNGNICNEYIVDGEKNNVILGSYDEENYRITNSYTYNSDDMVVLCNLIAKHMGEEDEADRLYNEWYEHNLAYYSFSNSGLFGFINSKYEDYSGTNMAEAAKSVDFGKQKETGIRLMVLKGVRIYSSRPHPKTFFKFL